MTMATSLSVATLTIVPGLGSWYSLHLSTVDPLQTIEALSKKKRKKKCLILRAARSLNRQIGERAKKQYNNR